MSKFIITSISTDHHHQSVFAEKTFDREIRGGLLLSGRIEAQNFRLRQSEPGYETDWHLAGDPTLIVIRSGTLRISLQEGSYNDFGPGDQFIVEDNLPEGVAFDSEKHGHRALVIGNENLEAIHIKLGSPS